MTGTGPTDDEIRALGAIAHRVGLRLLGSHADAEDLAQEAVVRTALRWWRVQPYAEAFVGRVATNLAIGVLRKRRVVAAAAAEHDGGLGQSVDRVDLVRAVRALPRRQRQVIVLRFVGDFSEREIALTLGCSPGSVKRHCSRGLATLRTTVADRRLAPGGPNDA